MPDVDTVGTVDSPPVQPEERDEPGSLPVPLADEDLPAWWGPVLDSSREDRDQLGGPDVDLDEIADVIGCDPDVLREFASTHPPAHRYLISDSLSVTVWAAVYVAIDLVTKRAVVLKVSRRVIEIEGLLIAKLDHHPHVVKAVDVFVHDGYPTTALEWCRHGTLQTHALRGVAGWRVILERAIEAGRGLAYLHECGLVHGDVKPSNILITHGSGKIADLGLAGPERLHGGPWGTPSYAPPERERGVFVFAGDVYSFALTIELSLDGHEGVPESIGRVLEAALATDYEQRPTLVRLLADLQRELDRARDDDERRQLEHERSEHARQLDHERSEHERRLQARNEQARIEHQQWRKRSWLQTAVMLAVLAFGGTFATVGVCRPASAVEVHLDLAVEAADREDRIAAVKNLELAMHHADHDATMLREVATVAESLGRRFVTAGDLPAAHDSWFVASECFFELGDMESEARVQALGVEHFEPSR